MTPLNRQQVKPQKAQLAARLMVGYEGAWQTHALLPELTAAGLSGVILFRHNLQTYVDTSKARQDLKALLASLQSETTPNPWLAIDQEGGAVERFPPHLLPNGLSPLAMAALKDESLVATYYAALAQQLRSFGINLNFAPTLDLNLNPANRVIGPRSFGTDPTTAQSLAQTVIDGHLQAGVCPVLKHFPGHGNGEVDSHEALPTLTWNEAEQAGFQHAIQNGAPAVLVAHGLYPNATFITQEEQHLPASLSKSWMQGVLRGQLGFEGVIFSDDMEMGALAQTGLTPLQQAVLALNSGCDVLVYRNAGGAFAELWQGLCQAWEQGEIEPEQHEQAVKRIQQAQNKFANQEASGSLNAHLKEGAFSDQTFTELSLQLHQGLFKTFSKPEALQRALAERAPLYVLLPRRKGMGNYSLDEGTTQDAFQALEQAYTGRCVAFYYSDATSAEQAVKALASALNTEAGVVLWVSWLPRLQGNWLASLQLVLEQHQDVLAGVHLAAGLPLAAGSLKSFSHWLLHSYRPQSIAATMAYLLA